MSCGCSGSEHKHENATHSSLNEKKEREREKLSITTFGFVRITEISTELSTILYNGVTGLMNHTDKEKQKKVRMK